MALVCTHGRHDLCCALRGRPVAAALADLPGWDVWECSHLGGDRFAPNILLLPDGDLFGGLDPQSAVRTVTTYADGRVCLEHHRGRMGTPAIDQALMHHAARSLGEDGRGAVRVERLRRVDEHHWAATVVRTRADHACVAQHHDAGQPAGAVERYQVSVVSTWSEPARLTCQGIRPARVLIYRLDELRAVP